MDNQMGTEWIAELAEQEGVALSWEDLEQSPHETTEERMQVERDIYTIRSGFHASDQERQQRGSSRIPFRCSRCHGAPDPETDRSRRLPREDFGKSLRLR